MKYSEIVEQTKKELEKSYGTAAVLTQLYNKAKSNYQANHNASVDALNKDYEQKKNDAAAQKMVNEKNTGEFLASRGLSYSGESAQAKLNSDISFNNTLSSLADSHSDGLTELNKKKNEYFAALDADYMENSVKARKELEQLARDMAADKIKYGDVTVNNSALGSESGSESGDGLFDPSMSAHQLATAIVKRYGTGGKVKNAYQNLDIRNYLEGLTERYTLADDYMDKVIFVLDALGYTAADEQGLYTANIVKNANSVYDAAHRKATTMAQLLFNDYDDSKTYAEKRAYMERLDYLYTRCESMEQFYSACALLDMDSEETEAYLDNVTARRNTENEIKLGQNKLK